MGEENNQENVGGKGKINASQIAQAAGGLGQIAATAYSMPASIKEAKDISGLINSYQYSGDVGGGTYDSWTQAFLANHPISSDISEKDMGWNSAQNIFKVAETTASGASTGAMVGGVWGGIAGGVLGLGAGLLGYGSAENKASEEARKARVAINYTNRYNTMALNNSLNNIKKNQMDNYLYRYVAQGGPLQTQGSDWNTGLNLVGNGGSHEQNPNGGIQMGIAPDGLPNLVEEGEVIWNGDYVFSKRLKVPKAFREKFKLGEESISYADAALKFDEEMNERPNDPISKRGREANLSRLARSQEEKRARIATKERQMLDTSVEQAMVEQEPIVAAGGGTINHKYELGGEYLDWINSMTQSQYENLLNTIGGKALNYKSNKKGLIDFANSGTIGDVYKGLQKAYRDKVLTNSNMTGVLDDRHLTTSPVYTYESPLKGLKGLPVVVGDYSVLPGTSRVGTPTNTGQDHPHISNTKSKPNSNSWLTGLRYAPVIGSAIGVINDLFTRPDYTNADAVLNAARGIRNVAFTPVGDYMRYTPLDRMFYLNQLNANAAATRRAIANTSGGNRGTAMAGILAADNNMMNGIGQLARQAEEYNMAQRQKVAEFNRATNMFNSEGSMKAQQANQGADEVRMRAAQAAAQMREAIDQRIGAARSANLTNFFDNLGNIGREEFMLNSINSNNAWSYLLGRDGILDYKGYPVANGGYITIKNKRRRK